MATIIKPFGSVSLVLVALLLAHSLLLPAMALRPLSQNQDAMQASGVRDIISRKLVAFQKWYGGGGCDNCGNGNGGGYNNGPGYGGGYGNGPGYGWRHGPYHRGGGGRGGGGSGGGGGGG